MHEITQNRLIGFIAPAELVESKCIIDRVIIVY